MCACPKGSKFSKRWGLPWSVGLSWLWCQAVELRGGLLCRPQIIRSARCVEGQQAAEKKLTCILARQNCHDLTQSKHICCGATLLVICQWWQCLLCSLQL